MNAADILQKLTQRFGAKITGSNLDNIDPWIEVAVDALPEVCRYLRDEPELRFAPGSVLKGKLPRAEQTRRIVRAMESGLIDALGHPTGRLLEQRPAIRG